MRIRNLLQRHRPLIALFRYEFGLELTVVDQVLLAVGTLLATCLLHYVVEQRYYQRATGEARSAAGKEKTSASNKKFALRTISAAGILAAVSASAWLGGGWAWREPSISISAEDIERGVMPVDRILIWPVASMSSTQVRHATVMQKYRY